MGSHSYGTECPNCQNEMTANTTNRPFNMISGECHYCGFAYYTKTYQMELSELNEIRQDFHENADADFKPLKKLPKMREGLING